MENMGLFSLASSNWSRSDWTYKPSCALSVFSCLSNGSEMVDDLTCGMWTFCIGNSWVEFLLQGLITLILRGYELEKKKAQIPWITAVLPCWVFVCIWCESLRTTDLNNTAAAGCQETWKEGKWSHAKEQHAGRDPELPPWDTSVLLQPQLM